MLAVIAFAGKQYKVQAGMVSEMEKVPGELGDTVTFKDVVLLVDKDNNVSMPKEAVVSGVIARQFRAKKIRVFKKNRRTAGFEKVRGHRQHMTGVLIKDIKIG